MLEKDALMFDDDLTTRRYQLLRADGVLRFYYVGDMWGVRPRLLQDEGNLRLQTKKDVFISERDVVQWAVFEGEAEQQPWKLMVRTREKRYMFYLISDEADQLRELLSGIAADSPLQREDAGIITTDYDSYGWLKGLIYGLTAAAVFSGLMLMIGYRQPLGTVDRIMAAILLLIPPVCLGLFLAFPRSLVLTIGKFRKTGRVNILWPVVIAVMCLLEIAGTHNITEALPMILSVVLMFALLTAVYVVVERRNLRRAVSGLMIFWLLSYSILGCMLANCALDPHSPQVHSGVVQELEQVNYRKMADSYYAYVDSGDGAQKWSISGNLYRRLRTGRKVEVWFYPGLFGAEHVAVTLP